MSDRLPSVVRIDLLDFPRRYPNYMLPVWVYYEWRALGIELDPLPARDMSARAEWTEAEVLATLRGNWKVFFDPREIWTVVVEQWK